MDLHKDVVSSPVHQNLQQIDRYTDHSDKIETEDLDWEEAKRVGLTDDEVFTLTYFSDIESQTIRYLRTLLTMDGALQPEIAAFLTTWNYEEYFHGQALSRLLRITGNELDSTRVSDIKSQARLNEWIEKIAIPVLGTIFSKQFPAVYMSFGAIQEMTTLRGYESIVASTKNPVLRTLCERIAKQERRHFAWYFNHARLRLESSKGAQLLTRVLLKFNWVPVGAGVKTDREVTRLFGILFPGSVGEKLSQEIDQKMGTLPGLQDISLMQAYFSV